MVAIVCDRCQKTISVSVICADGTEVRCACGTTMHHKGQGVWISGLEKAVLAGQEEAPVLTPSYYRGRGGLTALDVVEAFELNHHRASAVEYLLRAGRKTADPTEDLSKARDWIGMELARLRRLAS